MSIESGELQLVFVIGLAVSIYLKTKPEKTVLEL